MDKINGFTWPNDKKFAVCLTHDVDRVKKTYQYFTHFIRTKDYYHLKSFFDNGNEPYWNFEKIIDIEKKYGVKSTFFFLSESKKFNVFRPNEWKLTLGRYDINNEKISRTIQKLHADGWEIGLHGSYESYKNKEILMQEKKHLEDILGDDVIGIRQHYLNLVIPDTWKIQEEVGFKYDASFGSTIEIGFKEQQYLPFHPFKNQFSVIPLTIMDSALFQESKDMSDAWIKCKELIDYAEKNGALLTILWHQRVFNEKEFAGWSIIYEKILKYCCEKDAWITNGKNILEWYEDNNTVLSENEE